MSRGLGPQQRFVLAQAGRFRGEPVRSVAYHLGATERRALKVIASLVDRGLVVVVKDPWTGDRRIWTPEAHALWKWAQHKADSEREKAFVLPPKRAD
jgi:DNA-binding MarR family transcriptional regulator